MNKGIRIIQANFDSKIPRSTRLDALERYWNKKRGNEAMPLRAQIDPVEIARLLPIVLVSEIVGANARIRLLGSETSAFYGKEMRGSMVSELTFGAFTPSWLEAFASVAEKAAPVSAAGSYCVGTQHYRAETVLLPLGDDGRTLRYIFGGLVIKPASRDHSIRRAAQKSYAIQSAQERSPDLPMNSGRYGSSRLGAG